MRKNSNYLLLPFLFVFAFAASAPVQARMPREAQIGQSGPDRTTDSVPLQDLVRLALARNPELRAAARNVDVMRSKVSPAKTLPDPEVMFGQMNEGSIVPFTTLGEPAAGFSEVYLGFNQEFPFPGKLALKGKVADMEARAEVSRYRSAVLELISRVKLAFYDLYLLHKSIEIIEKERALLEQLEKIAAVRYSVGKGIQQDVLDAQVETSRMEERLLLLRQRKEVAEGLLNVLLDYDPDRPIGRPGEIQKQPLLYNLSELTRLAERNFPMLESQQRLIDRDAFALDLSKKGKYPDFGFTFVYHNRGSNRPYWTIGGTMKIPLYFGSKQRHEIEGAAASLAQSRHTHQSIRAQAFYQIKDLYLMATTAERLIRLYDEAIIRQASFSLESAVDNYEVGKIDFLTLLTSWTRVLNYELTYYEQLTEYKKALSKLEPLVGVELARD